MFKFVYLCLPLFTCVYLCLPFYPCLLVFIHVYLYLPLFTCLYLFLPRLLIFTYVYSCLIVRMAKATKWLQAILDYMKKVKSITSTVFGQFS